MELDNEVFYHEIIAGAINRSWYLNTTRNMLENFPDNLGIH